MLPVSVNPGRIKMLSVIIPGRLTEMICNQGGGVGARDSNCTYLLSEVSTYYFCQKSVQISLNEVLYSTILRT